MSLQVLEPHDEITAGYGENFFNKKDEFECNVCESKILSDPTINELSA